MSKSKSNRKENVCLIIRGLPGSGKTTVANSLVNTKYDFNIIDPDLINKSSVDYKTFQPKMTKNPSENIKMYAYLFWQSEKLLKRDTNIIWAQPWSRMADIILTIRNFAYYFTDLGESVWKNEPSNLIYTLPFRFAVIKLDVPNQVSTTEI